MQSTSSSFPIQLHGCDSHDDPVSLSSCGASTSSDWSTVSDLASFEFPSNTVYINTLTDLTGCNLTTVRSLPVTTVNHITDVPANTAHCAMYCAHEQCGSAKAYYKKHRSQIHQKCHQVHYIKQGARGMMQLSDHYSMQGECPV